MNTHDTSRSAPPATFSSPESHDDQSFDQESFLGQAHAILGKKGLIIDDEAIDPWLTDWRGRYTGRALALAQPADTAELSRLVALCASNGVPVVPQGGNSGMVGGATPDASGHSLLLSTRRMTALHVDADTMTARCGAGVILQTLHEAAAARQLRFPLSLGGKGSATIGGLVSTNAGGTQVLRHGVMRAQILGLEIVLPDGRVLDLSAPLKKDNRGFDLKQLWIGSEGTLGVVSTAVLQLCPAVAERRVVWAGVGDLDAARRLLLHNQHALDDVLEGFEVLPQACLDHVVDFLPDAQRPLEQPHAWHVLLECVADASGAAALGERVEEAMMTAFEDGLVEDAVIAANETQAEAFWQLRESISPAEKARGPAVQHDISVPVAAMPAFLQAVTDQIEKNYAGHEVLGFGHLGDGNIHLHVIAPPGAEAIEWEQRSGKAISAEVYEMVTQWSGSISAEHGIGQDKREMLYATRDPVALDVMKAVKHALDPKELMNPGKLL
ncbi:FAD-binding oxidoreductase [Croceicoccus sp. F390]|uniref:FAD-binding oxidoreductase n=1 Tax=Croceicoccus esteveae TaxID=3075597 RepID=A0ABU2ZFQ4_9SPHN|nr:FAD-binding oxidoreductase [Croceicoccus sp. F390]MDT0575235.1 FAD-binding oxidoreductase [Croceicoccus sp. F390]